MALELGATPMSSPELQKAMEDFGVDVEARLDQEHDAKGAHTDISCDSVSHRTGDRIEVNAGLHFKMGPWLFGDTDSVPGPAVIRPPSITAHQNDYTPSGIHDALVVELESSAAYNITGIVAEAPLRRRNLRLVNRGNYTITLKSASGSSTAAYQLYFGGSDYQLLSGTIVDLYYDVGAPIWRGPAYFSSGVGATVRVRTKSITFDGSGATTQDFSTGATVDPDQAGVVAFIDVTNGDQVALGHVCYILNATEVRVVGPTGSTINFLYTMVYSA